MATNLIAHDCTIYYKCQTKDIIFQELEDMTHNHDYKKDHEHMKDWFEPWYFQHSMHTTI